jgi:hypothetical protein
MAATGGLKSLGIVLLILLERSLISFSISEQFGARLRDFHVCAVLVHPEPAAFSLIPARYSVGVPRSLYRNGSLIFSM